MRSCRRLPLGHPGHPLRISPSGSPCRSPALFCAAGQRGDRPADPAPARRLLRHGHSGADRGSRGLTALALPITNGAPRASSRFPCPASISHLRPDPGARLRDPGERRSSAFYLVARRVIMMIALFRRACTAWSIRGIGHLCRTLQQNEELASSIGVNIAYLRLIAYAISSFFGGVGRRHVRRHLPVRYTPPASRSPTRSTSC